MIFQVRGGCRASLDPPPDPPMFDFLYLITALISFLSIITNTILWSCTLAVRLKDFADEVDNVLSALVCSYTL